MPKQQEILVVDDQIEICNILKEFLGSKYNVKIETSKEKAIEALTHQEFDLVITDLLLGTAYGMDILDYVKKITPLSEVIVITGYGSEETVLEAFNKGACGYIQKPMTLTEVEARVKEAMARRNFSLNTQKLLRKVSQVDKSLTKHVEYMASLYDLSRRLIYTVDYQNVVDSTLSGMAKIIQADSFSMLDVHDKKTHLNIYSNNDVSIDLSDSIKDELFRLWRDLGEGSLTEGLIEIRLFGKKSETHVEKKGTISSNLIAPLIVQSRIIGLLGAHSRKLETFSEDIEKLFYLLANHVAMALDNVSMHQHTRFLAVTDGLTGLLNYRTFQERLQHEFERSRRYNTSLSLAMIDLDLFKNINDTYGHLQGDIVLRGIANILKQSSREIDILARYGGEEFVLILPDTNAQNAKKAAERIRKSVEEHEFEIASGTVNVTVSIGVATAPDPRALTKTHLIEKADRALYKSKQDGRNKVYLAG